MNKQLLTTVDNRICMIYIDQAEIKQKDFSVVATSHDIDFDLPIANLVCLMLGPGTSITHRAVEQIAQYGCSIVWCGENINLYYALGQPLTKSSKNIIMQMNAHESKVSKLNVIRKMYEIRYTDMKLKSKSADELMGIEGLHVQNTYRTLSEKYGIHWNGRMYNEIPFSEQDSINKAITSGNQLLYAIIASIVNAIGYSTAIGFIHTGKMMSFVYDISDLYKESIILPTIFEFTSTYSGNSIENDIKRHLYNKITEVNIIDKVINDISTIFSDVDA